MARFLGMRGAKLGSVISAVCGLCFLCFGYAQGVLGGLLTVPAFLERFPEIDMINNPSAHTAKIQGAVMGTWNLGCFLSAILTIFIGDYLGRRKTLMLGLVLWSIGEIIQCSSYSFGQLVAGRFIAGFGNGFTTATVPAYQAECVKSHRKGTILMISAGAFVAFGLALSYWLVFGFAYVGNASAAWRVPIAFQIVFAVVAFVALMVLPESPRWLILTGREQEALVVLSALNDEDIEGPEIRDEFLQIKDAILVMSQGSTSSLTSNRERRNLHRVVLAYFVQVFQQMSGINLALQYLSLMFYTQMSYTGWVARLLGACAATEYFLASFITVVGIDRFWGRRSLMMFGAGGMCLCMVLLTVLLYLWQDHAVGGTNIAATVFLFGFSTFFAIGWQGMAWLYQVEIVPLRIRGPANALSTSGNWLFNFIVVFIAPIAFHNIRWHTYIIFAATNFTIIPLVYYLYPETAYRSLEEVDVLFHAANEAPGNPWLNVVKISKEEPLWFGRKGEKDFDYEGSEWHQRYVRYFGASDSTLGGSGNGSSGNGNMNEKRQNNSPSSGETATNSVGQALSNSSPENEGSGNDSSGSGLSEEQLVQHRQRTQHTKNKDSVASGATGTTARPPSNNRNSSYRSVYSNHSAHSAHSDPNWAASDLAPQPLRVPSTTSRPGTAHTTTTTRSESILYPGRLGGTTRYGGEDGTGIVRTKSGRETYLPDGVHGDEGDRPPSRPYNRRSGGSQSQSSLRGMARDAGRAY